MSNARRSLEQLTEAYVKVPKKPYQALLTEEAVGNMSKPTRAKAYFTVEDLGSNFQDVNFYGVNPFSAENADPGGPIDVLIYPLSNSGFSIEAVGSSQGVRMFNDTIHDDLANHNQNTVFKKVSDSLYTLSAYGGAYGIKVLIATNPKVVKRNLIKMYNKQVDNSGEWGTFSDNDPLAEIVDAYLTSLVG